MNQISYEKVVGALKDLISQTTIKGRNFRALKDRALKEFLKNLQDEPNEQIWWVRQQDNYQFSGLTSLVEVGLSVLFVYHSHASLRAICLDGTQQHLQTFNELARDRAINCSPEVIICAGCGPNVTDHLGWKTIVDKGVLVIGFLNVNGLNGAPKGGHFVGGHLHPHDIPNLNEQGIGQFNEVTFYSAQALSWRFKIKVEKVRQWLSGGGLVREALMVVNGKYRRVPCYELEKAVEIFRSKVVPLSKNDSPWLVVLNELNQR